MQNPVECVLELYEDCSVVLLPALKPACLSFNNDLLCLQLQSVQYKLQHDLPGWLMWGIVQ